MTEHEVYSWVLAHFTNWLISTLKHPSKHTHQMKQFNASKMVLGNKKLILKGNVSLSYRVDPADLCSHYSYRLFHERIVPVGPLAFEFLEFFFQALLFRLQNLMKLICHPDYTMYSMSPFYNIILTKILIESVDRNQSKIATCTLLLEV